MSVLVTKPGTLNVKDKAALRRKGIVAIEAEDPSSVRFLNVETGPIGANGLLFAAMQAIKQDGYHSTTRTFAKLVAEWIAAETNPDTSHDR
jgi:hypothetical protein